MEPKPLDATPVHDVAVVLGTRPEAVKLAPVVRAMRRSPRFRPTVVTTGQHREMLDRILPQLELEPDVRLDVMRERQSLHALSSRLHAALGEVLGSAAFDAAVVQGDTTTALCGAIAAFYQRIPVAHVEAGLRSGVQGDPFPEEVNRRMVAQVSTWHFAPTVPAGVNLLREGVPQDGIEVTGNTVVDNLLWVVDQGLGRSAFDTSRGGRRVLVTLHRRENQGAVMSGLAEAVLRLVRERDVQVVLPLHRSPAVREALLPVLSQDPRIRTTEPLDYLDFTATLADADLVLTDSGGVQEEAPSLDVPVLVLRRTTERMEVVRAGGAELVGTDPQVVLARALALLDDRDAHARMARAVSPFGDGRAAGRILDRLDRDLSAGAARPPAHLPVPVPGAALGTPAPAAAQGALVEAAR
ncbi:non-hydrolyzing UDP-N-acetylglucosamine 2-epimerase [Kineococcus indalonis]|uniref:non-hydrolyzing UDP-N-acetylglucosamine 2-epimerase n=1 Tax=Kineococcus indalonis TaxID=2696566 RepID=UPI001412923B|nr:UDP-N-acetylglucosamine 2-epimerase (non-hydrolyzing) [Kineococcus indalonis]NAZ88094.1 UDP-N-acetylglucosamine 2-epimerase (non-hydrolyzing) [Kineococcus indalonis]